MNLARIQRRDWLGSQRRQRPVEVGSNSCRAQLQTEKQKDQIAVPMEMGSDQREALPSALAVHTRRIIGEKSALVAITTQEGIDGYREKAMRTAHVEQIELINITELLPVLKWTRQSIPLWRNVAEQSRWMEPEESQPSDSCQALA